MAKDDQDAVRGTPEDASLARALRQPIRDGSLEGALHAARSFQLHHPGDGDAKRVVEALEQLMSEVWLGADEADARYADAAARLERTDLPAARAAYAGIVAADPDDERAGRLALQVEVVRCALEGEPLPSTGDEAVFDDSTRVADDEELPLAAFALDDETRRAQPLIPPSAFPDEPTRQLSIDEYELVDGTSGNESKETTRVAKPGELPIEQLRNEMRTERRSEASDAALDLLLDEMEPPRSPAAAEPPLQLDIDVEDEVEGEASSQPTELGADASRAGRRTPPRSFSRPDLSRPGEEALERPGRRASPSRTFAKPDADPVLTPPPMDELDRDGGGRRRFDTSEPPPPVSIPRADELNRAARPATPDGAKPPWVIHEPGGASPPPDLASADPLDSWPGVRVYETEPATFEPGVEGVDADSWDDPTEVGSFTPEERAEAAVAVGNLGEALRIYQDLATQSPNDQRLWDRVAEIARMLQQRSGG